MTNKIEDEATLGGSAVPVLAADVVSELHASLTEVGEAVVRSVQEEVSAYAREMSEEMARNIRAAVRAALGGFLLLASREGGAATPMAPAREGAYELGRGEARAGRSTDALLSAYRVGARVAWREMAATAIAAGAGAEHLGRFAELVFAYIDDLSAATLAGHADELANSGLVLERNRTRLATALLEGAGEERLVRAVERAGWEPPVTLTAVLVGSAHVRTALGGLDARSLRSAEGQLPLRAGRTPDASVSGVEGSPAEGEGVTTLLVADVSAGGSRQALLDRLTGLRATVGPTRPWDQVSESAVRAWRLRRTRSLEPSRAQDTEAHLIDLVLHADPDCLADLRARVLAPMDEESSSSRERLEETLRAWLAHRGHRESVAEALHVHPQTVRYRMGRIRELFGETWDDPEVVLALGVVLAVD